MLRPSWQVTAALKRAAACTSCLGLRLATFGEPTGTTPSGSVEVHPPAAIEGIYRPLLLQRQRRAAGAAVAALPRATWATDAEAAAPPALAPARTPTKQVRERCGRTR